MAHLLYRGGRATARRRGIADPLVTVACHEDLAATDLVGRYLLSGDETVWIDGPLTRAVRSGAIGVDVSAAMLREAGGRAGPSSIRYERGDALALPLADGSVDAATIAFGLRNVADYRACLAEMARVTRPGGRVVVLEIATPSRGLGRWVAELWFRRIVPLVGRAAGGGSAYRYLPESVRRYPPPDAIATHLRAVGLAGVRWRRLALGMVTLHAGRRV
jgi:demethylmenaquinone methyltransferase/2-methoxy-6-polyprenyl-1,4-benzoquinol methylase